MSVVINTNSAAISASNNLAASNAMLQKSLNRLSSGSKIVNPADDAGGLAVSMKLSAAAKRSAAANTNVANAVSFLQTQDGALKVAAKVLDRMSELATLYQDVTKSGTDLANYSTEFTALSDQLTDLQTETFNSEALFDGGALSVVVSEDGTQTVGLADKSISAEATALDITDLSTVTAAIEKVATLRATNGAEQSRLGFASEVLTVNKANLEAANSRIVDVDVAAESTQLARYNTLVQAGTAMLAQANQSSQVALRLLN